MRAGKYSARNAPIRPYTDRKSTRLNSSHSQISYAVFCLKEKSDWAGTYGRTHDVAIVLEHRLLADSFPGHPGRVYEGTRSLRLAASPRLFIRVRCARLIY